MIRNNTYHRLLVVSLIVVLGGCRFSSSSNHNPGYLVVGIESNPLQLDPRYSTDANSVRIGGLIYNSLLRSDENSRLQLELAENWQRIDAQTYIFDLRRNITFHNGQPLTAADVKFTYESILQAKNLSPKRALLKPLQAIDQLEPYRLRFRLADTSRALSGALYHRHCSRKFRWRCRVERRSASRLRTLHVGITPVGRDGDLEGESLLLGRETFNRGTGF